MSLTDVVRLGKEHVECRWVTKEEFQDLESVADLRGLGDASEGRQGLGGHGGRCT